MQETGVQGKPQPMSAARFEKLTARMEQAPHLGSYEGGAGAAGIWIGLLVVAVLVLLVYYVIIEPARYRR